MSVVMLPDAIYSMLFLPVFLAINWWVLAARPRGGWLWLAPFALGLFVLQTLRPTTAALTLLLLPALGAGLLAQTWSRLQSGAALAVVGAHGALAVVGMVAFVAVDRLLDTGARAYNANVPLYRIVIFLPPADNSPAEQRIEAAKARFREQEGQAIERARFLTYLTFPFYDELPLDDVRAVWLGRLRSHPPVRPVRPGGPQTRALPSGTDDGPVLPGSGPDLAVPHPVPARRWQPGLPAVPSDRSGGARTGAVPCHLPAPGRSGPGGTAGRGGLGTRRAGRLATGPAVSGSDDDADGPGGAVRADDGSYEHGGRALPAAVHAADLFREAAGLSWIARTLLADGRIGDPPA